MVKNLTAVEFETEVLKSDGAVLVDFWAPWCGPCRAAGPVIDELSESFSGKARFFKVNVDDETALAARYKIFSIPCVLIFRNGEIVSRLVGTREIGEYEDALMEAE